MSSKNRVIVSGVVAAVVAVALIGGVLGTGILATTLNSPNNLTGQSSSSATGTNSNSHSTSSSQSQSGVGAGSLSVLLTDPPNVPAGVTHLFVSYSNVQVHIAGYGNQSGWLDLSTSGELDLMSIVNFTQTIVSANVPSESFNLIRFNVTSAIITFGTQNYTADMVYQRHIVTVGIEGGEIRVSDRQSSALLVDLSPTVLMLNTTSGLEFVLVPSARGYSIPAQSLATGSFQVGNRQDISSAPWWIVIQRNIHFDITSASLNSTSLSLTVENTGNESVLLRMVAVGPYIPILAGQTTTMHVPPMGIPSLLSTPLRVAYFVIEQNGSLVLVSSYNHTEIAQAVSNSGYALPAHSSVNFTYSGQITLGLLQVLAGMPTSTIISGNSYIIAVVGQDGMQARMIISAK